MTYADCVDDIIEDGYDWRANGPIVLQHDQLQKLRMARPLEVIEVNGRLEYRGVPLLLEDW